MTTLLRPALSLFVLLCIITGICYPLAITGIARIGFPAAAGGSLIVIDDRPVGSALIGQQFTDPAYFWGRPSATLPHPYNGAASGGANQGPLNPALMAAVKERITALTAADPDNRLPIPVDLITTSASGLDPHISPAAARYQVARVARARQLSPAAVSALIAQFTEGRQWGVFGEPRVNVLKLNLALASRHPD
jgi:K+-transporting ATPase ATPase C chain